MQKLPIDVGKLCPRLAELLHNLKPVAAAAAANKNFYGPFFQFQGKTRFGRRLSGSDYSNRARELARHLNVSAALANKVKNANSARYLSATEDLTFGTDSDEQNRERCRRRGQEPARESAAAEYRRRMDTGSLDTEDLCDNDDG